MTATQRAVWRNGGSNSAENVVRTRTEVARPTCSESRRCAKPLVVVCYRGTRALLKTTCGNGRNTRLSGRQSERGNGRDTILNGRNPKSQTSRNNALIKQ